MSHIDPDFLRSELAKHVNDKVAGKCLYCGVRSCPSFVTLWDRLAKAGEVMVLPEDLETTMTKLDKQRH